MTEQQKRGLILLATSLGCSGISFVLNKSALAGGLLHGLFVFGALVFIVLAILNLLKGATDEGQREVHAP